MFTCLTNSRANMSLDASGRYIVPLRPGGPSAEGGHCMRFGVAQPSEDTPVVITAITDDGLVALTDDDEAEIFGSRDPDVHELVEAATRAYGPTARAMPVMEYRVLAHGSEAGGSCLWSRGHQPNRPQSRTTPASEDWRSA